MHRNWVNSAIRVTISDLKTAKLRLEFWKLQYTFFFSKSH